MDSEKEASEESALEETALEETVVGLLKKKKMTLSLAESCTGGAVAADIVNVPGASEVFMCGYVTYTNRAKRKCLGVKKSTLKKVNKLRREIPDIVLRTTLISGFPGETQEDHEELMSFVDEMEFDRLGVFTYSPEEDTPAATMPDQVAEEVKEARRDEIMELQQEISYDKGTDRIGQELLVMIEGKVADESAYIGRTYGDAPKVDGYIFVQTGELLMTGDFAKVRVTGALEYDLIGELADEYTE